MSVDIDYLAERARQVQMAKDFARDVMEVANSESIGTWHPPSALQGCHFIRCGVLHHDGSMPPTCARVYRLHKSLGAGDAPKGMRPQTGFESDAGAGVYVYYFRDVWEEIQSIKRKNAMPRHDPAKEFADLLGNTKGVEIQTSQGFATPKKSR